jgi:sterol desaturase/sphingolipid hydroxylase (fatty acid hydroxylase superfamily)
MRILHASIDLARLSADISTNLFISLATAGSMLLIALTTEKFMPHARRPSSEHAWFNIRYTVVMLALLAGLRPLLLGIPLMFTHALDVGRITFAPGALGWSCAFLAVLVMTDLLEYLFHRAQHRFSVLWGMHELHHSAEHYDVTLGYRHFWFEPLLKMTLLYPLVGVVFNVPATVGMAVAIVFLVNHNVAHMNVRFSPRRFSLLVSHPQYHRLHHSRNECDYNKNFCDLLPFWDILFGTLQQPARDEFVDVGLDSGAAPRSLMQALLWPWRRNKYG